MRRTLQRLARLNRIVLRYRDLWGDVHRADEETLRKVLRALQIPCGSDSEIGAALESVRDEIKAQVIRPVVVIDDGEGACFWMNRPEHSGAASWSVRAEDGGVIQGQVTFLSHVRTRHTARGQRFVRTKVDLSYVFRPGYYDLEIAFTDGERCYSRLIVAPRQCYVPEGVNFGRRTWGVAAQLYSISSSRNWGIGDFTDVRHLLDAVSDAGGGVIGVSPLTSLPLNYPEHVSPYSPQSRYALHPLFIDIERVDGFSESKECGELLQSDCVRELRRRATEGEVINYAAVSELKILFFEALYRHFREAHVKNNTELAHDFNSFCDWRGGPLRAYAVYEALQRRLGGNHLTWSADYRSWKSPAVSEFEAEHREQVDLYRFIQWQAWKQLARLGEHSLHRGLALGLYIDIPLGADGGGTEVWMDPELFVQDVSSGAPPDECNVKGQIWGLPPYCPWTLGERRYEPYIQVLRYAMEQAGAVRIDHVMSLNRLFWVPDGTSPERGVYVRYPFRELLAIVRLESVRNRCLVVGEDLGTVPDTVRQAMDDSALFSYRLFMFMNERDGRWMPPENYPERCVTSFASHDLPTIQGFWSGHDLMLREHFVLASNDAGLSSEIREQRENDKQEILMQLAQALRCGVAELENDLVGAVNAFLLKTSARIVLVSLEDLAGWVSQVNLPGVVDGYPSWRARLKPGLEQLLPRFSGLPSGHFPRR